MPTAQPFDRPAAAPLTIVVLNMSAQDAAFEPIRALAPARLRIVHAKYRSSWAEVSARRTGTIPSTPEPVADTLRAALAQADVLFSFVVPRRLLELAPRLRWLHTPATGIDHLRGIGLLESDMAITAAGGLFAPVIAEHVVAGMLHFAKRLPELERQRRDHTWRMIHVDALEGRTLGLIGVGAIGSAVAQRAQAFGMRVVGIGRQPPEGRRVAGIDELCTRADLPRVLRTSDYVVIAVADTADTRGMIGAAELAVMPTDAVLINVARGSIIDEDALIAALRQGRLRGAALDVFAREPLPADSALWELPNVLLTPHVASNVADYLPRAIVQFGENVRRYLEGEPLLNEFDRARGY